MTYIYLKNINIWDKIKPFKIYIWTIKIRIIYNIVNNKKVWCIILKNLYAFI